MCSRTAESEGLRVDVESDLDALQAADAIYLNAPRTLAHARLLRSRGALNLRIDDDFMAALKPHCVIMDPMQRSGDFTVEVEDDTASVLSAVGERAGDADGDIG